MKERNTAPFSGQDSQFLKLTLYITQNAGGTRQVLKLPCHTDCKTSSGRKWESGKIAMLGAK